jgi:hypothetical protein
VPTIIHPCAWQCSASDSHSKEAFHPPFPPRLGQDSSTDISQLLILIQKRHSPPLSLPCRPILSHDDAFTRQIKGGAASSDDQGASAAPGAAQAPASAGGDGPQDGALISEGVVAGSSDDGEVKDAMQVETGLDAPGGGSSKVERQWMVGRSGEGAEVTMMEVPTPSFPYIGLFGACVRCAIDFHGWYLHISAKHE